MMQRTGRKTVAGAVAVVVVVIVAALGAVQLLGPTASPSPSPSRGASASPTAGGTATATAAATSGATATATAPSGFADLDGVAAPADKAHRLPMAIMIDDNAHARPQAGMTAASIVYQAPADGGEVRYMLVFQEGDSSTIGPVRSGRPYFVQWASEYHALFGHYGGDAQTRTQVIPKLLPNLYNMDALAGGSCPYHRVSTNVAPYNAFTDSAALLRCAAAKGYPATIDPKIQLRPFTDDVAAASRPPSGSISVPYPHQTIGYTYDPASNSYLRSIDGKPEIDAANGQRVTTRNVVVLFQPLSADPNQEQGYVRPVVGNVGSGTAYVFHDGKAIVGTWKKASETALTRFYDASGAQVPLVRGRIFIQVVPTAAKVTYKAV